NMINIPHQKTILKKLFLAALLLTISTGITARQNLPGWAFGPFIRPDGINPVLSPDPKTTFLDPMSNKWIAWEASDVFNPAAVKKDSSIYVLYRAEDNS